MGIASQELRCKAVEAYKSGDFTQQQLANAYGVHHKTLFNWLKADKKGESQVPRKRGCRPRVFNAADELKILELILNDPSITLEAIKENLAKDCDVSVVHRTLIRLGITYKKNSKSVRARSRRHQKSS
jgi:transposase